MATCLGEVNKRGEPKAISLNKVFTLAGNGVPGYSAEQVNNPNGLVQGRMARFIFVTSDNQRIRRLDLSTQKMTTIAGNGEKGYRLATEDQRCRRPEHAARDSVNQAGDIFIAEDNHIIRKVNRKTGIISTVAGTGVAGFSGDGGLGIKAQLRSPHSIAFDARGGLLICDIGNNRVRRLDLKTGIIRNLRGER